MPPGCSTRRSRLRCDAAPGAFARAGRESYGLTVRPYEGDIQAGAAAALGPPTPADRAALSRMRTLTTLFFALDGFLFANFVVRVPDVKTRVGASAGALGLALLGVSAGAVITMMITGRLCARYGSRPVTVATAALMAFAVALPARAGGVGALGGVLLVFGAGYGGLNVSMNSVAVEITARLGRPVMPMFHAAYSFGGLSGAVIGGLLASAFSPTAHLTGIAALGLAVTSVAGTLLVRSRALVPEAPGRPRERSSTLTRAARRAQGRAPARTRMLVLVFGTIAMCTAYGEGALADWGALHLRTDLHTSTAMAAAGYASFSVAMLAGRLAGTWMLTRAGRTFVLATGGLTAAAGMLTAALAPSLPLVLAGFVLVGLGLSNQFPAAIAGAGALTGPGGVAAASTLGYFGMLAGPPVIGLLTDHVGLPVALTTIALLAAVAAAVAVFARQAEGARTAPAADRAVPERI